MADKPIKAWKDWRIWVALALILAVVSSFAFKGPFSLAEVLVSFKLFPAWALFSAVGLCSLQVLLMGFRLRFLAPKNTKTFPVLWSVAYGQFANAFMPARAGDALKIAILCDTKKGAGLSIAKATGILVGDRPVDISCLFLWIALSGSYNVEVFKSEKMPSFGTISLISFLGLTSIILLFKFGFLHRFPKLEEKLKDFGKSAGSFLDFRHGIPAAFFSLLTWACEFYALMILVNSIGFPLAFSESVAVIVLLNLAIALPISVANVGPFEAAMTYALTKLGLPTATALAIAVLHHAFQVLGTCGATVILMLYKKVNL